MTRAEYKAKIAELTRQVALLAEDNEHLERMLEESRMGKVPQKLPEIQVDRGETQDWHPEPHIIP